MKILLLGTTWPFRPGGISTFNERLARALIEKGHEVIIYTFSLQYPSFLFPGKTQYSDQPAPADLDIRIKVNTVNPFNWIRIGWEIRRMKPDWLLLRYWIPMMGPALGTIARIVRGNRHTRVITLADNILPHEKRVGDTIFTRYFTGSCDGFITMSGKVLDDLKRFRKRTPALLTPHPLYDNFGKATTREEACSRLRLDPGYRYLLFFGFIRDYKGLDWLLTAMADPRLRKYPVRLLVAGEFYTSSDPYFELIYRENLSDKVLMHTNFISDCDVTSYFGAADLVVQPYKSATQSGVTQIAYHFNKPMLVTNVGGLGELVPDGVVGYTVEPNPKAIADAIVDFFENNRYDRMSSAVQDEKKRFSWDKMVETFEQVDREIVKKM